MAITVLHVAPHPDDEAIAAGATLVGLRQAGHRVVNLACSLGRSEQQDRRRGEVEEACRRADFELVIPDPPIALSRDDDLGRAQREIAATVERMVVREGVDLLVAPSPHDGHHGHEAVGRAARDAVRALGASAPRLWLWGLWADLPVPTLFAPFDEDRLARTGEVLAAHVAELERNDYRALLGARGVAGRVLGSERVFGWGEPMRPTPYAELLTELIPRDGALLAGRPRTLDLDAPLDGAEPDLPLDWWLDELSVAERRRRSLRDAPAPTP